MKIHDWSRVTAGTFHDFHAAWITHIKEALNQNVLPAGFYAMAEQPAGQTVPDILTLTSPAWLTSDRIESDRESYASSAPNDFPPPQGAVALANAPPRVSFRSIPSELARFREKRRTSTSRSRVPMSQHGAASPNLFNLCWRSL